MKIGIIYTARTEELTDTLNDRIWQTFGQDTQISDYQDVSVLQETVKNGFITRGAGSRYGELCMKAVLDGADAILSTCCVMGDAIEPLKTFMRYLGTPLYSIDEPFCRSALLTHEKICMLATAEVAAFSVGHTMERYERLLGLHREKRTVIVQNAAGLSGDAFARKMIESVGKDADPAECIVLAQPSMAFCGAYIREHTGKKVYTAIDDPVSDLAKAMYDR